MNNYFRLVLKRIIQLMKCQDLIGLKFKTILKHGII